MSPKSRRTADAGKRLERAQAAAETVEAQGDRVNDQVSFAERLLAGWRSVHEHNHLAQLFRDEGRIG